MQLVLSGEEVSIIGRALGIAELFLVETKLSSDTMDVKKIQDLKAKILKPRRKQRAVQSVVNKR